MVDRAVVAVSARRAAVPWCAAALLLPLPARAETALLDEIIVTARREAELLRSVPLNVNVIGADEIDAGSVEDLQTLAARIPGLTFEAIWGGANSFPIMRGQNQPSVAGDAVGMFVDGVYQANRDAIDVAMLDLARVEVVHGPQGALFGHSTFAGLISYVSAEPTERPSYLASANAGSPSQLGGTAMVSAPIDRTYKARIAASWRRSNGTWDNAADPTDHLGSVRQWGLAGTIATRDDTGPLSLRLSARLSETRRNQPAAFPLDYRVFNCGSRDRTSGAWSYFCGQAPIPSALSLSAGVPESRNRTAQVALHLAYDFGGFVLRSDSSYYEATADSYRDFDGGADGELFGVCLFDASCTSPGNQIFSVVRVQAVNTVQRRSVEAREWTQEVRLEGGHSDLKWMVGGIAYWTRGSTVFAYGAERGLLLASERLSALVLSNPQRIGPPSGFNFAVTSDPGAVQTVQNDAVEHRRTLAGFTAIDWRLASALSLRGELRGNWQRVSIDSRRFNFQPSFGTALAPRDFFDLTGRIGLAYRPDARWLVYASHARGSRTGGINAAAGLIPDEQTYAPETNWTTELGMKFSGNGLIRSLELTGFHIDWSNTQINGLSLSPGVTALVLRNTRGIETWGIEVAARLRPLSWLELGATGSLIDPKFKPGSEDPGSNGVCGLSATSSASSFCTVRPSTLNPQQLVPDISGQRVLRAAQHAWSGELLLTPAAAIFHGASLRIGISYQGNVFERAVNALSYGERTLLDARLSVPFGAWSVDVWGTNLTDSTYVRAVAGRPPFFYPNQPRPSDMILGDRRRIGISLRVKG